MRYALVLIVIASALSLSGCMGMTFGLGYTQPDGTSWTGSVHLDPSFAKQKK